MNQNRLEKREKFLADHHHDRKKRNRKIVTIALLIALTGTTLIAYLNRPYKSASGGNFNIGTTQNYNGQKIEMTSLAMKIENGRAVIPLDTLTEKKIVYTEYRETKRKYYGSFDYLPLAAVVTPAGRVILATSICEPCYGNKFYIENSDLVCVACGTRWRLDDLMGIGGGCVNYPPEELPYTVEGNKIVIDESILKNWKPRYYTDEMENSQV